MNKLYFIPIGIFILIVVNALVNPSGFAKLKGFKMPFKEDEFTSEHGVKN